MTDLKFLELCAGRLKMDDSTIRTQGKGKSRQIVISTPMESYNSWPRFPFSAAGWALAKEYLVKKLEKK